MDKTNNIPVIMVFDFHKIIRLTGGLCRKLYADLKNSILVIPTRR